jgi:hypothetical protein
MSDGFSDFFMTRTAKQAEHHKFKVAVQPVLSHPASFLASGVQGWQGEHGIFVSGSTKLLSKAQTSDTAQGSSASLNKFGGSPCGKLKFRGADRSIVWTAEAFLGCEICSMAER